MRQKGLSTEVSARTENGVDLGLRFSLASYRAEHCVSQQFPVNCMFAEAKLGTGS